MAWFYTTEGSVRGGCGHKHRTLETAERCCKRDMAACKRGPGRENCYSDRIVYRVYNDGTRKALMPRVW